jgi:uncharacterized repeat protein (TIGR03806 family)
VRHTIALLVAWLFLVSASPVMRPVNLALITGDTLPPKLSDFRFFTDERGRYPNKHVTGYGLNTPLFSDYADKFRAVYLPPGTKMSYRADGVFDFPVGTALIKTFAYVRDPRMHILTFDQVETRLLLRRKSGWVALPYIWNADGSDALLVRAGRRIPVTLTDYDGTRRKIDYAVPNVNQCKGCHDVKGALSPIGPKARNLNNKHQLETWLNTGLLDALPKDIPAVPRWIDTHEPVALRARAYLDINCAHCHNRDGPANTSGLWLDWNQKADVNLGIGKRPTAAGRGSGDLEFAIAPGKPDQSYLIHRMESLDPGVAMPELSRSIVHKEGVALVQQWIAEMK